MAKSRKRSSAKSKDSASASRKAKKSKAEISESTDQELKAEMDPDSELERAMEEEEGMNPVAVDFLGPVAPKPAKRHLAVSESSFVGSPISPSEAVGRWPRRYKSEQSPKSNGDEEADWQAKCHYSQAMVDGVTFNLLDDAYVQAEEGQLDYISRIIEFFEGVDGELYFTAQWFYRAQDTGAIKDLGEHAKMFEERRVFLSEVKNTNSLDCIVSKVRIAKVLPNLDLEVKEKSIPECDLYYDMKYSLSNLTFSTIDDDEDKVDLDEGQISDALSAISTDSGSSNRIEAVQLPNGKDSTIVDPEKPEMALLDLYSGCGAMSTGLCIGASLSNVKLVTRWAVDMNPFACESLKLNHPKAQVRNEAAEDFLSLLKEWEKLCNKFGFIGSDLPQDDSAVESKDDEDDDGDSPVSGDEYEVEQLLAVCYGDPNNVKNLGLHFKVRWKGYDESEDTWEPTDGLGDCEEKLKEFVKNGHNSKLIPLPGDVDFLCGGPPCQGISGFNRFRDRNSPLNDTKNIQMKIYMDIIEFLKPRFTLMENVVDLLKFADAFLGRYAIGRLVSMNYQARLGMMAAGSYGVPQFRMRVFLWGASPTEKLPQYPLPTHEVSNRGVVPKEFEDLLIGYNSSDVRLLEPALFLKDAFSELPSVTNDEDRDEQSYEVEPESDFQKYISLKKHQVVGFESCITNEAHLLFDHRPLKLNKDDLERVEKIPKKKGANFRDLEGVLVGPDNKVFLDESIKRPLVSSGKPLVPDYAVKFVKGRSLKPFGRVWWDEIISTVVTRAEPHNQAVIHPEQDRVLTVRELARLQGFPDFYQLCGPIKERYIQVGNAVAVPVGTALGYALGRASQGLTSAEPTFKLPFKFPECLKA